MAENSNIAWTTHTFNPWRGCTKISPGCTHCYAETLSHRNPRQLGVWGDQGTRVIAAESAWREPLKWDRKARAAGERHRVFCASLADVFEERPELVEPRQRLFRLIQTTPNLDWLLLTKRPANIRDAIARVLRSADVFADDDAADWLTDWLANRPPRNVWLGVSVEDQQRAVERIPHLLTTPAAVRFLSVEPLLSQVDISSYLYPWSNGVAVSWVIVGGESGPGARPMDLAWARSLRDQCRAANVPFFFKQKSGPRPGMPSGDPTLDQCKEFPG